MTSGPAVDWEHDERLVIDGTAYVLMHGVRDDDELRIFKPRMMLEAYDDLIDELQGATIVELGILEGGSAAYLVQRCEPRRFVGIDRREQRCNRLDRFVAAGNRFDQVRLHHGVDQADQDRLRAIVAEDLAGEPIDLVIDDASHVYGPTVASFEVLFPMVRPGGLYIIEDWTADDWLQVMFVNVIEHRDPMARAVSDQWLGEIVAEEGNVAGQFFRRWVAAGLRDPSSPHHEPIRAWRELLRSPDANPHTAALDSWVEQLPGPDERPGPTLGTLGLQLLLAVKGLCPSIASVTVTPWWIAVRRGGAITEPFSVASISDDRLDVTGSYRRLMS